MRDAIDRTGRERPHSDEQALRAWTVPAARDLQPARSFDFPGINGQAGQTLGQVIVEVARQPATFILVRRDEPSDESCRLTLRQATVSPLNEQPSRSNALSEAHRGHCHNVPPIVLPNR